MSERVRGLAAVLSVMVLAAACAPPPPQAAPKPAPKPVPEPAQTPPSAVALGPVRIVEPVCTRPPGGGEVLEGGVSPQGRHYYEISNPTAANAVIKIRDTSNDALVVAVFLPPNDTIHIGPLVDGVYRMTYAMGGDLASDCRRLDDPSGYGQASEPDTLISTFEGGLPRGVTKAYSLEDSDIDGSEGDQALTAEKYYAP
jgi:hypothetical protein